MKRKGKYPVAPILFLRRCCATFQLWVRRRRTVRRRGNGIWLQKKNAKGKKGPVKRGAVIKMTVINAKFTRQQIAGCIFPVMFRNRFYFKNSADILFLRRCYAPFQLWARRMHTIRSIGNGMKGNIQFSRYKKRTYISKWVQLSCRNSITDSVFTLKYKFFRFSACPYYSTPVFNCQYLFKKNCRIFAGSDDSVLLWYIVRWQTERKGIQ